jgi:hypothetical protein
LNSIALVLVTVFFGFCSGFALVFIGKSASKAKEDQKETKTRLEETQWLVTVILPAIAGGQYLDKHAVRCDTRILPGDRFRRSRVPFHSLPTGNPQIRQGGQNDGRADAFLLVEDIGQL